MRKKKRKKEEERNHRKTNASMCEFCIFHTWQYYMLAIYLGSSIRISVYIHNMWDTVNSWIFMRHSIKYWNINITITMHYNIILMEQYYFSSILCRLTKFGDSKWGMRLFPQVQYRKIWPSVQSSTTHSTSQHQYRLHSNRNRENVQKLEYEYYSMWSQTWICVLLNLWHWWHRHTLSQTNRNHEDKFQTTAVKNKHYFLSILNENWGIIWSARSVFWTQCSTLHKRKKLNNSLQLHTSSCTPLVW